MIEKRKANTDKAYFITKLVKNKSNIAHSAKSGEWENLISVGFLLSLLILLSNDFYFKTHYSGIITGKLSDFAGLFVFSFFFSALIPTKKGVIFFITFLGFIFWKMPVSDVFIENWNKIMFYQIDRVVDYSDYIALLILPFAYYYKPKNNIELPKKINSLLKTIIPIVSVFSFFATAGTHGNIKIYKLNYSKNEVSQAFNTLYEKYPEYNIPKEWMIYSKPHDKGIEGNQQLLELNADSVNFDLYIDKDEHKILWLGFVKAAENWYQNDCELALVGYVVPGQEWKYNKNLTEEKKKQIINLFENEVLLKVENILKENKTNYSK